MIGNDGRVRATQGKTQHLVSDFSITIAVSPIVMICTEAHNWPGVIWWLIGYGVNDLLSWVYYIGEPAVITTSTWVCEMSAAVTQHISLKKPGQSV